MGEISEESRARIRLANEGWIEELRAKLEPDSILIEQAKADALALQRVQLAALSAETVEFKCRINPFISG